MKCGNTDYRERETIGEGERRRENEKSNKRKTDQHSNFLNWVLPNKFQILTYKARPEVLLVNH